MSGVCVPMFSLGSSQLILGRRRKRGRNRKSFPPPLPGPLPEPQFPLGGNGDLARHVPAPAPSTGPNPRHPPGTAPSQQSCGPRADLDPAGWGGWLHTKTHL